MAENSGITNQRIPHNIIMEDRHHLTVSGVSDIDSFDEQVLQHVYIRKWASSR